MADGQWLIHKILEGLECLGGEEAPWTWLFPVLPFLPGLTLRSLPHPTPTYTHKDECPFSTQPWGHFGEEPSGQKMLGR